jgi:hypothetical protein
MILQVAGPCSSARKLLAIGVLSFSSMVAVNGAFGQTVAPASSAAPEFEVATIKLVKEPNPGRMQDRTDGRRYKTGIEGRFDFTLTWTADESQFTSMGIHVPSSADNPNAPPGLFTALQEQLGLKLEPQKILAEVLVIDRVERPSEN